MGTVRYTWDANGNMLSRTGPEGLTAYTWDAENRLVGVQTPAHTLAFGYDDDGIRFYKVVDGNRTDFLIDPNQTYQQVLQERDTTGTLLAHYTFGHDLLAQDRPGIGTGYYHYDAQLSTRFLTDPTANIINTYEYAAFGPILTSNEGIQNHYLYTGEYEDQITDFLYLRARYYDKDRGMFISRDPIHGVERKPISLNGYRYCLNNPLNCTDFTGKFASISENAVASAIYGYLATISMNTVFQGITYASARRAREYLRQHPEPDALQIGIQYQKNIPRPGFEFMNAQIGFEFLLPKNKSQIWVYLYGGIGFFGACSFGGIGTNPIFLYAGAVWDIQEPTDYNGLFFSSSLGGSTTQFPFLVELMGLTGGNLHFYTTPFFVNRPRKPFGFSGNINLGRITCRGALLGSSSTYYRHIMTLDFSELGLNGTLTFKTDQAISHLVDKMIQVLGEIF